jgi:hypothetical protein
MQTSVLTVQTTRVGAMDGKLAKASVMYTFEDGSTHTTEATFLQPTGEAGPVYLALGREWVLVEQASRYGDRLSHEWIERFLR